jgi:hypothetical protein
MKNIVLSTAILILGMNCFSNNVIPNKNFLSTFQDYQQDSKIGYIQHRVRREWIQVTITFEKQEGQERWKATKITDRGEFSQDPAYRYSPNTMDSPIMKLNPNNPISVNYKYYIDTPWGTAYFNL